MSLHVKFHIHGLSQTCILGDFTHSESMKGLGPRSVHLECWMILAPWGNKAAAGHVKNVKDL